MTEIAPIRRKIRLCDVEAIAERCSKTACTEKSACIVLGINPTQWYIWKQRHKNSSQFDSIFTRVREEAIDKLLTDVEDISDGNEALKIKPDWRGKEFLLKVRARDRFNFSNVQVPVNEVSSLPLLTDALRRAFAGPIIDINYETVSAQPDKLLNDSRPICAPLRPIPPRKQ